MNDLSHIRRTETAGQAGELLAGLTSVHWGLLPALLAAPILARTVDPIGSLAVLLAAIMASYDVAVRRIPNALTGLTFLAGLVLAGLNGPVDLGWAFLAGLIGLGMMGIFYVFGAVGAGDVKAIAALATFFGPMGAISLFATTAICGGFLAVAKLIVSGRRIGFSGGLSSLSLQNTGLTLPYGLAILAGTVWVVIMKG